MRAEWTLLPIITLYMISVVVFTHIQKSPNTTTDDEVLNDTLTSNFIISNFLTTREFSAVQKSIFALISLDFWNIFGKSKTRERDPISTSSENDIRYTHIPSSNYTSDSKCRECSPGALSDIIPMILNLKYEIHEESKIKANTDSKKIIASLDAILQKISLPSGNQSIEKEIRLPELQQNSTAPWNSGLTIEDVFLTAIVLIKFILWTVIFLAISAAGIALWTDSA